MDGASPARPLQLPRPASPKGLSLRAHLFCLIALALVPAVGAATAAVMQVGAAYQDMFDTRLRETAFATASALNAEIERIKPIATMLAESSLHEATGGTADLFDRAKRLAMAFDHRIWMRGPAPDFAPIFNTAAPAVTPMDQSVTPEIRVILERAVAEQRTIVGDLAATPLASHASAVVAPIERDGRVLGLIGLGVPLERLAALLQGGSLAHPGFTTLVDGRFRVVASSSAAYPVGREMPTTYRYTIAGKAAGLLGPIDIDGQDLALAFARLPNTPDWTVLVAEPPARLHRDMLRPVLGLAIGVALAVGLGLAGASLLAARLLGALRATLRAAGPLAQDRPDPELRRATLPVAEFAELRDAYLATAADRARHAEAAARERSLLLAVVEGTGDLVWIGDPAGTPVLVNGAARALRGGAGLAAFPPEVAAAAARVAAGGRAETLEVAVADADGAPRGYLVLLAPWQDGAERGVVGAARDVTAMRRNEARLREAEHGLQHLARRIASEAMASGLAHELSQPLAAAGAYLGTAVALLEPGQAPARAALGRLAAQLQRAGAILRNLRGFIGRAGAEAELAAPGQVVRDAVELALAGGQPFPAVSVLVEVAPGLPEMLMRVVSVQQVVVNLVRNAMEALAAQPPGLVRELRVAVRGVSGQAGAVEVEVADSGPGLTPAVAAQLFQPFVSTKPDGMGLGLSICRTIVEAHGGRIAVAPGPLGGTIFTFGLRSLVQEEAA